MKIKGVRSPHALCPIFSDLGVRCIVCEEMNLERRRNDNRYV